MGRQKSWIWILKVGKKQNLGNQAERRQISLNLNSKDLTLTKLGNQGEGRPKSLNLNSKGWKWTKLGKQGKFCFTGSAERAITASNTEIICFFLFRMLCKIVLCFCFAFAPYTSHSIKLLDDIIHFKENLFQGTYNI